MTTYISAIGARRVAAKRGLLTAPQAAQRSGLSYRQLDTWTRTGLIETVVAADGSGSARLYDPEVVEQIRDLLTRINACPFPHNHPQKRGRA